MGDVLKNIFQRQQHIVGTGLTVHPIVDRNKSDLMAWKIPLQIVAHIDVVPSKTGEILHDNTVYPAIFNVGHHSLEGGSVKVGTGISVVGVVAYCLKLRIAGTVVLNEPLLVENAVALHTVTVLP